MYAGCLPVRTNLTLSWWSSLPSSPAVIRSKLFPPARFAQKGITNVEQARKGFGVNLVLEGSLQESGNRVRITYSLVDATSMRQLSADTINRRHERCLRPARPGGRKRGEHARVATPRKAIARPWSRTAPKERRLMILPAWPRILAGVPQGRECEVAPSRSSAARWSAIQLCIGRMPAWEKPIGPGTMQPTNQNGWIRRPGL